MLTEELCFNQLSFYVIHSQAPGLTLCYPNGFVGLRAVNIRRVILFVCHDFLLHSSSSFQLHRKKFRLSHHILESVFSCSNNEI